MTDLRDARLKKALDSAPDGDVRAGDDVREAILNKARLSAAAAATNTPKPVRTPWWDFSRPWNSGLATVGLVAFVGVLIWGQGLLKQPQQPLSEAMPAPAKPAVPQTSAPQPMPAQTPAPAEMRKKLKPEPEIELRDREVAMAQQQRAAQAERKQDASAQKSAAYAHVPVPVPEVVIVPSPPHVPPPSPVMARIQPAPAIVSAPMSMPAPTTAPMPPPIQSTSVAPPAALDTVTVRGSAVASPAWTALRLMTPEGPVLLQRESLAPATQALLQQQWNTGRERLAAAASGNLLADQKAERSAPALLKIELLDGERSVGHLDIGHGELQLQLERALSAARQTPP